MNTHLIHMRKDPNDIESACIEICIKVRKNIREHLIKFLQEEHPTHDWWCAMVPVDLGPEEEEEEQEAPEQAANRI